MKMLELCDHCPLNELPIVLTKCERELLIAGLAALQRETPPTLIHQLFSGSFVKNFKGYAKISNTIETSPSTNLPQPILPETLTIGQGY